MELHQAPESYSRVIHYDQVKEQQVRLTINTFRDSEYIHLRKYYLDFNEEWKPTPEGVAMHIDITNYRELFAGTVEVLSFAESKLLVEDVFVDLIKDLYK